LSERTPQAIVVSAPSGAGKSTALNGVLRRLSGIRFSISHTTRAPRGAERDGVEYHFVTRESFERLVAEGGFLEHADVHGQLYGTAWSEYRQAQQEGVDLLLDLDVQGAAQVRAQLPAAVTVFLLPPSFEELERRLRGRGVDSEGSIKRRLEGARTELLRAGEYDYAIVNDEIEACVEDLVAVVRSARCRAGSRLELAKRIVAAIDARREEKDGDTAFGAPA
jgi:guanylate kinase